MWKTENAHHEFWTQKGGREMTQKAKGKGPSHELNVQLKYPLEIKVR